MSDVQALVDALAVELHRPVGIDDQNFRAIAYSSHEEEVDPVRLASILHREAPDEVRKWLESLRVREIERHLRVPSNDELRMAARVCIPLRFDSMLLGFLWLIDEPEALTERDMKESERYAEEMALTIYRERLLQHGDRRREQELIGDLLGLGGGDAEAAATELLRAGHLVPAPAYAVLRLGVTNAAEREAPDSVRVRLTDAAEQVRRAVAPHHLLVIVNGDEVVVALAATSGVDLDRRAETLAEAASKHLATTADFVPEVGVGETYEDLSRLALSYEEARAAARIGVAIGREGPVTMWADLGAFRTLVMMLGDKDPHSLLPASFRRLLESNDGEILVDTLERYLDLGGDARAAAEQLYIHRSSLYGRLHRIEEVAGIDLRSGEDRLEFHLAVRLWRLGARPVA